MVRRIFQIVVVGFVLAPVSVPAQTVPLSVTVRAGRASAFGGSGPLVEASARVELPLTPLGGNVGMAFDLWFGATDLIGLRQITHGEGWSTTLAAVRWRYCFPKPIGCHLTSSCTSQALAFSTEAFHLCGWAVA